MKARTLSSILEEYLPPDATIDFISIDVEGTEPEVLRGLDFARYHPRVLVVESNTAEADRVVQAILDQVGYRHALVLGVNHFYVTTAEDRERIQSLEVNCEAEHTLHPRGNRYTFTDYAIETGQSAAWQRLAARIKNRIKRLFR